MDSSSIPNNSIVVQELKAVLKEVQSGIQPKVVLCDYSAELSTLWNEPILFLKPEVTEPGVGFDGVMDILLQTFDMFNVQLCGTVVVGGEYLKQYGLIDQHYGVINKISRFGHSELPAQTIRQLMTKFGIGSPEELIGGHQVLERFPFFNAESLNALWENVTNEKIASGTYLARVLLGGTRYILVNGFHPFQIEYFTRSGTAIVVFALRTSQNWRRLRTEMAGATDPSKADQKSIRASLLRKSSELKIRRMSQGYNGVHLSAGPFEALAELVRYFSAPERGKQLQPSSTTFGYSLERAGFSLEEISRLIGNCMVDLPQGRRSLYDETEDLDSSAAVSFVVRERKSLGW